MSDVQFGKRYRVVNRWSTGTTMTVEGVVTGTESRGQTVAFEGGHCAVLEAVADVVDVIVEPLPDPLPTTPGSVILTELDTKVGRVTRLCLLNHAGRWLDEDGCAYTPREIAPTPFTIRFDAGGQA